MTTQTLPAPDTHETAVAQFVDASGVRLAYRRFGKKQGIALAFFQHFAGNLENWDPKITDGFAHDREVILFNIGCTNSTATLTNSSAGTRSGVSIHCFTAP
jgi:hypothetical protein